MYICINVCIYIYIAKYVCIYIYIHTCESKSMLKVSCSPLRHTMAMAPMAPMARTSPSVAIGGPCTQASGARPQGIWFFEVTGIWGEGDYIYPVIEKWIPNDINGIYGTYDMDGISWIHIRLYIYPLINQDPLISHQYPIHIQSLLYRHITRSSSSWKSCFLHHTTLGESSKCKCNMWIVGI
jgi:hypothetical protein